MWRFREHMQARGRDDLILPVHYLDVTRFDADRRGDCFGPGLLVYLRSLQWVDFRELGPRDSDTEDVRRWLAEFARRIEEALYRALPSHVAPKPPPVVPKPEPVQAPNPVPSADRPKTLIKQQRDEIVNMAVRDSAIMFRFAGMELLARIRRWLSK